MQGSFPSVLNTSSYNIEDTRKNCMHFSGVFKAFAESIRNINLIHYLQYTSIFRELKMASSCDMSIL